MTGAAWRCIEAAACLLEEREREAVLGDLAEVQGSGWRGLIDVLGLAIRRQAEPWKSWRPWVAGFGLAWPGSFFLMGVSLSVSHGVRGLVDTALHPGMPITSQSVSLLLIHLLLLIAWAWTGGFVLGRISRRTLWASILLCSLPCTYCMAEFPEGVLQSFCLLLFLLPAFWGVRLGMRGERVRRGFALALAAVPTFSALLTWRSGSSLFYALALVWPGWYVAASGHKRKDRQA